MSHLADLPETGHCLGSMTQALCSSGVWGVGCFSGERRSLRRMEEAVEDVRGGGSVWWTRLVQFLWGPRSGAWARGELKEGVGVGWGVGAGADRAAAGQEEEPRGN